MTQNTGNDRLPYPGMTARISGPAPRGEASGGSALQDFLRMLRRRKGRFALTATVVFGTVAGITFLLPTRYTATALIEVAPPVVDPVREATARQPAPAGEDVESRAAALAAPELARRVVTALQIGATPVQPWYMKAACGAASLVRQADLGRYEIVARYVDTDALTTIKGCGEARVPALSDRTTAFLTDLSVKPVGHSRIIEISYTGREPKLVADTVNLLIKLRQDDENGTQTTALQRSGEWLTKHVDELSGRITEIQKKIEEARAKAGLSTVPQEAQTNSVLTQQLSSAAASAAQAKERLAAAEARSEAMEKAARAGDGYGAIRMLDEPVLVALSNRLADLSARRAEITRRLGPLHPDVIAIDTQVKSMQERLNSEWGKAVQVVRSQLTAARAESARLDKNLEGLRANVGPIGAQMAPVLALEQELAGTRAVYDLFISRQKELAARAEIVQSSMQVVSNADIPDQPSFPAIPRFLAAGLALGLAAGLGSILLAEHLAKGVSNLDTLERDLELPLLSSFPLMSVPRRDRARVVRYVLERPFSAASEAVRSLLTALTLSSPQSGSQSVLVTSAMSEEGKTTIGALLAAVAAQSGRRVVVLDGDSRRASLHTVFGRERGPGFSDWLSGNAALHDIVQHDEETNVDVISAGTLSANCFGQSELLKIGTLISELKLHYDLVVIDTPPLLAMSDALLFSSLTDQTIYVCRWQKTTREAVVTSLDRLRSAGAILTGVVLSMVDAKQQSLYSSAYGSESVKLLKKYYAE